MAYLYSVRASPASENISEERVLLVCQVVESELVALGFVKLDGFSSTVLAEKNGVKYCGCHDDDTVAG